jgi:hypothetical protein
MILKTSISLSSSGAEHGNSLLSAKISPLSLYGNAANSVISIKRSIL